MSNRFRLAVLLLAMGVQAAAFAEATSIEHPPTLDEVVVVGRFPGPPLWKISKDGHALWILPLVDLYPKRMRWDSARVEKLIAQSDEYLSRPVASNGIYTANPLLLVRALRLYNTMAHLPGGKTLADALPPDLYQRFAVVKSRYFPKNGGIEKMTVGAATRAMQQQILEQQNLEALSMSLASSPALITAQTDKWLKRNKTIRRTQTGIGSGHQVTAAELKTLDAAVRQMVATPEFAQLQVACFETVLSYFERDLEPVKRRANAWAQGRIDGLVTPTPLYSLRSACMNPFSANANLPAMKQLFEKYPALAAPDMGALMKQSQQRWLDAAEQALARNTTTFTLLAVDDVVNPDGLVAQLRSKGYAVEISAE